MRPTAIPVARVGGFALASIAGLIPGLIMLPLVARASDEQAWTANAVGMASGLLCAVVASHGLTLTGPPLVTRADAARRAQLWRDYLETSIALTIVLNAGLAVPVWILAPERHEMFALAVAFATSLGCLSPVWFVTGSGQHRDLWIHLVFPRLLAAVLVSGALLVGGSLFLYPVLTGIFAATGAATFTRKVLRGVRVQSEVRRASSLVEVFGVLGKRATEQGVAGAAFLAGNAYSVGYILMFSAVGLPAQVAQVASADRLFRYAQVSVSSLSGGLQAWVCEEPQQWHRLRSSGRLHIALGFFGALGFAALGPWATGLLFGQELDAGRGTCAAMGVTFFCLAVNSMLGNHVLLPSGRVDTVFRATLLAAGLGLPAVLIMGSVWGAAGAASGLAVAELAVLSWQLVGTRQVFVAHGRGGLKDVR